MQHAIPGLLDSSPSMKVPPKRKGNNGARPSLVLELIPSMKVPPKRKGNYLVQQQKG